MCRIQQDLMEKEKHKAEEAATRRQKHAVEVRKQVRDKEEEKLSNRRAYFEEGARLDLEAKDRSVYTSLSLIQYCRKIWQCLANLDTLLGGQLHNTSKHSPPHYLLIRDNCLTTFSSCCIPFTSCNVNMQAEEAGRHQTEKTGTAESCRNPGQILRRNQQTHHCPSHRIFWTLN